MYKLIKENDITSFNYVVNDYINKGWELYGTTVVGTEGGSIESYPFYAQAIVNNKDYSLWQKFEKFPSKEEDNAKR